MTAGEQEIYRAAIQGDREAFETVIRTHSRPLFAVAYGILQNREEAEDVVQDAFVKVWKSRWRVRDPKKFPAWLATIVRHRARDVFRKRRYFPCGGVLEESVQPDSSTAETNRDNAERDARVHSALASLPELHRSALMLRYFEDMDYHAIENTLGLTNGALRGILGRSLASLRKQLRPSLAAME